MYDHVMVFLPLLGVFAAVSFVVATITVSAANVNNEDFLGKFIGSVFWSIVMDVVLVVAWFITRWLSGS